jgi:TusA-related sulfurtransferase
VTNDLLDERGKRCPAPVLALGRSLRTLTPGSRVTLLTDDLVALTDVPVWCEMVGARIERQESAVDDQRLRGSEIRFLVRLP